MLVRLHRGLGASQSAGSVNEGTEAKRKRALGVGPNETLFAVFVVLLTANQVLRGFGLDGWLGWALYVAAGAVALWKSRRQRPDGDLGLSCPDTTVEDGPLTRPRPGS